MSGILAVWNDRDPAMSDAYERWYVHDHLPDRLGVPGFQLGRRFEAIEADREFFTYYRVDAPSVLMSAAYRARLREPTEETRRIMPHWRGMVRAVCSVNARQGELDGAYALSLRWPAGQPGPGAFAPIATLFAGLAGSCRVELWREAALGSAAGTAEAQTRREPDAGIAAAVVAEFCRVADLEAALRSWKASGEAGHGEEAGLYRFLCSLSSPGRLAGEAQPD